MRYEANIPKSTPFLSVFILISIFLLFGETLGWTKPLRAITEPGINPVKWGFYHSSQKIREKFEFIGAFRVGQAKTKTLEEEIARLTAQNQRLKDLENENQTLRMQLGSSKKISRKLLPTQVIGFNSFTLDAGEKEGIKVGQVVLFQDNMVGKISRVSPFSSQVMLITDPQSKITVKTTGGAFGILVGQYGEGLSLEKVVQGDVLNEGDTVVTGGDESFPKGLVAGKIGKVEKKESEVFQKAQVKPLLNFEKLELVFVVVGE